MGEGYGQRRRGAAHQALKAKGRAAPPKASLRDAAMNTVEADAVAPKAALWSHIEELTEENTALGVELASQGGASDANGCQAFR